MLVHSYTCSASSADTSCATTWVGAPITALCLLLNYAG